MKKLLLSFLLLLILAGCIYLPAPVYQTTPQAGRPVVTNFAVIPAIVAAGQNAVLVWDVSGAQAVNIDNGVGPVPLNGSKSIVPSATTAYILTAVNSAGSSTAIVTVAVVGRPPAQLDGERIVILPIVPGESGSLVKSGVNYAASNAVCAGDNPANQASRAFLSFDLTMLPPTAVVSEAELDLTGYSVMGHPTYSSAMWGNMGALEIYQYQYGSAGSLGRVAYEAIAPMVASLKLIDLQDGAPLIVDVTLDERGNNIVQKLISDAQGRCQFRLGFFTSTNWDSIADMICLDGAVLKIKYSVP